MINSVLGDQGGHLSSNTTSLDRLLNNNNSCCLLNRCEQCRRIDRHDRPKINDLNVDPVGGNLICCIETAGSGTSDTDQRHLGTGTTDHCRAKRNDVLSERHLALEAIKLFRFQEDNGVRIAYSSG